MLTVYRRSHLFGYLLSLIWGFVAAAALVHVFLRHGAVAIALIVVVVGLILSAVIATILNFVIDWIVYLLFRIFGRVDAALSVPQPTMRWRD